MTLKAYFTLLSAGLFLVSCKTASSIVTSKNEAQKLGIYQAPDNKITTQTTKKKEDKIDLKIEKKSNRDKISNAENSDYIVENPGNSDYISEQLINKAIQFLGVRYKTGGTTTDGMDCSGFIIATFSGYNVTLPRTSNEMSRSGEEIDKLQAKKGDLIFFRTNGRSLINHVGMIIEILDDEIKFIHSSTQKGVIVSSTKDGYYKKTFAQINRILN